MNERNGTVDADKLTEFTAAALRKTGVPDKDARITAQILVEADLRGIDSHGVAHLASFYIRRIQDGAINVRPEIRIVRDTASTAVMDGDRGLGFVVGCRAMQDAMGRAEKTGAGFITVRNSTHYGAGGYYSMMTLPHDMIGISLTQGGVGVVAPGSRGRGVGLNVISVAVPAGSETSFVLDMATSVVASGKLEIAAMNGSPIPEGWAVDIEGNLVTDVAKVTGGILPLGGTTDTGAYKGFGLTVLVDILCSVLSGTFTAPEMDRELYGQGLANHFFGALNISSFMPVDEFKSRMDAMIKAHHDLPKAKGAARITLAGEPEQETKNRRRREGIPLHPTIIKSLKELAEELGITYDL